MAVLDLNSWQDAEILSDSERQELKNLDSRSFGKQAFFSHPECVHLKLLLEKASSELEDKLTEVLEKDTETSASSDLYLKLGHFSLLLERYPQALSAYQKYFELNEDTYWKNAGFLFGLGIVYFHYNSSQWSIRAFQQVLYIDQTFERTKDVHLFLALLFKNTRDFESARKHFNSALRDPTQSCLLTFAEIKFHLAHTDELEKNYAQARKAYEEIVTLEDLDNKTKGLVLKQIGWLHETVEEFDVASNSRFSRAVDFYQQALTFNSEDGEVYYYLGRCHAALGDVQAAFGCYRSAIDKRESCPDTWCSIGVLYQQQGQPSDALQAFICAVQLDEDHTSAWLNLGILYESEKQARDAFICYQNAAKKSKELGETLRPRLEALRAEVMSSQQKNSNSSMNGSPNFKLGAFAPTSGNGLGSNTLLQQQHRKLHSIDEAWNLPIPAELTSRRKVKNSKRGNDAMMMDVPGGVMGSMQDATKRQRPTSSLQPNPQSDPTPSEMSFPSEDYEMMRSLETQNAQKALSTNLQVKLAQLQQKFQQFMGTHKRYPAVTGASSPASMEGITSSTYHSQTSFSSSSSGNPSQWNHPPSSSLNPIQGNDTPKMETDMDTPPSKSDVSLDLTDTLSVLHSMVDRGTSDSGVGSSTHNGVSEKTLENSDAAAKFEGVKKAEFKSSKPKEVPSSIHIHLSPELLKAVEDYDNDVDGVDEWTVFNIQLPPPLPPEAPEEPSEGVDGGESNTSWLHPPTPTVTVESKREAYSEKLMEFCLLKNQPVTVIKGLCTALKIDLGLFTTKSLCEYNPEHPVEVRNQINQPPDENWGGNGGDDYQCWPCGSSKSTSTITKYAHYQVSQFVAHQQDIASGGTSSSPSSGNRNSLNGTRSSSPESSFDADKAGSGASPGKSKRGRRQKFKHIKFGTNVDLSDEKKWGAQLQEISKLPIFCRLVSAANMLSHLPHTILGMNSLQLYMKVPGCRTPGHQENLNFCSVNINIGPGNCEWFSVDTEYWGAIQRLCERNNTNFLHGSWWPLLEDLEAMKIPVYRFIQRPGDLVFINAGVVHWVQSTGFCNNIAWNVGPLNGYQYSLAVERYEWNKLQNYRSLVPMITLTWNLARNVRVTDESLYLGMKSCLIKSLKYNELCLEEVREKMQPPVEVRWHGRQHGELVNFCATCDQEVFNILYTKQQLPPVASVGAAGVDPLGGVSGISPTSQDFSSGMGRKPQVYVYCRSCALRISSKLQHFVILQEYKIEDLTLILNHFKLKPKEIMTEKPAS